ncbi:uncharacterized protein METZ01_LOCUS407298 [marine metagenome]|uniref:Uncharacterized protein n=1 Tax=marine metagenome TaxID=408172 RepID=A0A382W706_9ZZZZ
MAKAVFEDDLSEDYSCHPCVAQEQHREDRKQDLGPFRFSTSWRKSSSAVWLWQLLAFAQQSQANQKKAMV